MIERGVFVSGRTMVAPHPLQVLPEICKMCIPTVINEEMVIRESMEEEFNGDCSESIKHTIEAKDAMKNAVQTNTFLKQT